MKDNALYLEVDEDITSAIDKLSKSAGEAVQIVVPKRSTMLQSIINLKLLKKAAESAGKELVLVTGDRIATDLAARVGLAVAPSLGAKAVLKEAEVPDDLKSGEEIIEAGDPEPPAPPEPPAKPRVAAKRLLLKRKELSDEPAPAPAPVVPLPTAAVTVAGDESAAVAAPAGAAAKAAKVPRVPNFGQLQRRVLWVAGAVVLVLGYWVGMYLLSSAKVTLYANGTKVDIDTSFAVDPKAAGTDATTATLAGQLVTVSKDLSGPFTPTGKKDAGTKAGGTMTVLNSYDTDSHTLVTGTRFQAPDGRVFRTTEDVTVPSLTVKAGKTQPGTATVHVTADDNGDSYNEAPASYSIMAYAGDMKSLITGQGGQMSGGTSKTVTVVAQGDIDTGKQALLDKDKDDAARALKAAVPGGYITLDASQATTVSNLSPAPAVDAEGSTGTLSLKVTYTVLSVKQTAYQQLVEAQELKQIGADNQIYNNGLGAAQVTAGERQADGKQSFHLTTEAYGGQKLDTKAIARQLSGKRFGDAADAANRLPGVSKADIALWPGWSTKLPLRPDKITVTIQVASNQSP